MSDPGKLLETQDLTKVYKIGGLILGKRLVAVDNVNLALRSDRPSILSLVGESGSGKTTVARMMLRLVDPTHGDAYIDGKHLFTRERMKTSDFRRLVQPIFQNPFESFSLHKPVDSYLFETARNVAGAQNRAEAEELVQKNLVSVGLDMSTVQGKYTNQFSGGELQRISIARALIPQPKLIIADEPVSMIDASLRMNIVNLFLELKEKRQVSFLYITHDLSLRTTSATTSPSCIEVT
jgi:peptide/nickel transport system ATP-binding protein